MHAYSVLVWYVYKLQVLVAVCMHAVYGCIACIHSVVGVQTTGVSSFGQYSSVCFHAYTVSASSMCLGMQVHERIGSVQCAL
jgi:hypothetical protein